MNVPENNLVFSLHVLRYALRAHGAHVALQNETTVQKLLMSVCTYSNKKKKMTTHCINHVASVIKFPRGKNSSLSQHISPAISRPRRGDGSTRNIILLK